MAVPEIGVQVAPDILAILMIQDGEPCWPVCHGQRKLDHLSIGSATVLSESECV